MEPNNNILIISAHLDDIPLSIGGCLLGNMFIKKPDVIVVFTISRWTIIENHNWTSKQITEMRQKEERRVAEIADYNISFLGYKEAYSRPGYEEYNSIFTPRDVKSDPIYPTIKNKLLETILSHNGIICCPLAIGDHIDHRIIHNIIADYIKSNPEQPIMFFEDLYYADQVPKSIIKNIIAELKKNINISPYLFTDFNIEEKTKLLEIYKSQLNQELINHIVHYYRQIGNGERIWCTPSSLNYFRNIKLEK
jgi:LmbE family N-acetylglucosaminyl deacetylase